MYNKFEYFPQTSCFCIIQHLSICELWPYGTSTYNLALNSNIMFFTSSQWLCHQVYTVWYVSAQGRTEMNQLQMITLCRDGIDATVYQSLSFQFRVDRFSISTSSPMSVRPSRESSWLSIELLHHPWVAEGAELGTCGMCHGPEEVPQVSKSVRQLKRRAGPGGWKIQVWMGWCYWMGADVGRENSQ